MTDITVKGAVRNVVDQVTTDASLTETGQQSDQNAILEAAAEAGITLVYVESDQNMIERLANALTVQVRYALTNAHAGDYGASPADVTGMTFGKTGGSDGTSYLATTSTATVIDLWAKGIRLMEAQDVSVSGKVISIGYALGDASKLFRVAREDAVGAPGNTHWAFYVEGPIGSTVDVVRVAADITDVPAIGIDGATGDCYAWIAGSPVTLSEDFEGFMSDAATEGLGLFGSCGSLGAGGGEMTLAIDRQDFAHQYEGGFDVYGNDAS
jgi:hypothetical protein